MGGVVFYRDASLPYFEVKSCSIDALTYKKHAHEEYSLGFIEKGRTALWYEGKKIDIDQEKFVIIPPNKLHACNPYNEEKWQYDMLYIEANWLEQLSCEGTMFRKERPIVRSIAAADRRNMAELMKIFTSSISPLAKETAMIDGLMNLFASTKEITARNLDHPYEQVKLQKVQEYLQARYLDKITLDDLEKVAGLNKFYLVRLFKKEFNISPHAYQTLLRINFAKKELRLNQPLVDVAAKLGFFDQSHFTKAFKGYVGATPEVYRRSSGKNQFFTIHS
ncbi:MAG: AraC family transcriptional regulator [Pelosinus sp.]|nr:AraC family transcriptional regulator [Pelosinus sp.]